jgi:hypothetical protein
MISTIIQYSTIDFKFLEANLKQVAKFSDEIIVPICDHFFNGTPENEDLLQKSYEIINNTPKCTGYIFEWSGVNTNTGYYHNVSRALGTSVATNDWLLFIDADEIIDDNFSDWFNTVKHTTNQYWLTCHWYFREPIYRATTNESAGLLIRKEKCEWNVNIRSERQQLLGLPNTVNGDHTHIFGLNGRPLVHHFSWVRTKQEMLTKVLHWGHKNDQNWNVLIEEEFSRDFIGTDFVHGYQYEIVENKFGIINADNI